MDKVVLGKTGLEVNKNGFGALPIQRVSKKEAVYLLQKAFYNGINYFDTARAYSDSEEKMGAAFEYTRDKIIISTKSQAQNGEEMRRHLEESLKNLRTDYIDIYQFHNPAFCPKPGDGTGLYEAALQVQKKQLNPDCTRRCSFLFLIWRRNRISRLLKCAGKKIWDLSR